MSLLRRAVTSVAAFLFYATATFAFAAPPALSDLPIGDPVRAQMQARVRLDAVTDTATDELISPSELAKRLVNTQLLFIGEEHTNLEFHRVQLRVIQALHDSGRQVLIGLEMYPYTQRAELELWTQGRIKEGEFLLKSGWYETWSHHWGYYRDIFNYAQANKINLYGINAPRDVVRTVRAKGWDALDPEARQHMPLVLDVTSEEHRQMFRASFSPDDALHLTSLSDEQREGMYRAQVTWDGAMGWNAAKALADHGGPKAIMVVLIGAGHVMYGLGAERQLKTSFKGRISSLIPVPVRDADDKPVASVRASYANFLWGVPATDGPGLPVLGVSLAGKMGKEPTKVIDVDKGSPADQAGIKLGDVLLALGGSRINATAELQRKTADYLWGDTAELTLRRGTESVTLLVPFRRPGR
jgi:uncharacterized iron-regulated protein